MKPTKNRVFCRECNRKKMLFETEKKAQNFMKFNAEEIKGNTGKAPVRAYFCEFCGGWHVTSRLHEREGVRTKTDRVIEMFERDVTANKKIKQETHNGLMHLLTLAEDTLNEAMLAAKDGNLTKANELIRECQDLTNQSDNYEGCKKRRKNLKNKLNEFYDNNQMSTLRSSC